MKSPRNCENLNISTPITPIILKVLNFLKRTISLKTNVVNPSNRRAKVPETHILGECDSRAQTGSGTPKTRLDRKLLSGKTCSYKALKKEGTKNPGVGAYYTVPRSGPLFMFNCGNKYVGDPSHTVEPGGKSSSLHHEHLD